ncbi:MAG: fumarylacetoacetate hydrolase family protein [Motiliproteus sp.]
MPYQHQWIDGEAVALPIGKIVCVGRNYAEHARELNNPVPASPLLFIKPSTALCDLRQSIGLSSNRGPVHYETELAVLIGQPLTQATPQQAEAAIAGIGLGLDLTLRELQSQLKSKGHPWEVAKAFDHSCPMSPFVRYPRIADIHDCHLRLEVDGELRQHGSSAEMLTPVLQLISLCSNHFTLLPGDIVMTGTPAGVGVLEAGMKLRLQLEQLLTVETQVVVQG